MKVQTLNASLRLMHHLEHNQTLPDPENLLEHMEAERQQHRMALGAVDEDVARGWRYTNNIAEQPHNNNNSTNAQNKQNKQKHTNNIIKSNNKPKQSKQYKTHGVAYRSEFLYRENLLQEMLLPLWSLHPSEALVPLLGETT